MNRVTQRAVRSPNADVIPNNMLHRRIICQLIHFPKLHVSMRMKMLCNGDEKGEKLCIFGYLIRRWFRHRANANHNDVDMDKNHLKFSAQILWDYLRIDNPLEKSDLIFVLGNSDLRTADYAAKLYHDGLAPLIAVSGKEGHSTKGKWTKPEAVMFAEKLMKNNVPSNAILIEPKATNTGENIRYTQKLLQDHPDLIPPQSVILVQTPFMGRRCLATFLKQWEKADHVHVTVSSPPIPLEKYPNKDAGYGSLTDLTKEMVRNMQRIQQYPSQGFQVHQHVPSHVLEAFRHLQTLLEEQDCKKI